MKFSKSLYLCGAITLAALSAACSHRASLPVASYDVIPMPQEITAASGHPFILSPQCVIAYPEGNDTLARNARLLSEYLEPMIGRALPVTPDMYAPHAIRLHSALSHTNPEAYRMSVSSEGVLIDGASAAGNFYGIQTLRKAVATALPSVDGKTSKGRDIHISLPAGVVSDFPRFPYRGAHLDVARHFFPLDSVKRYVDILALHNCNRFHWHLTDDQGWRIEIPSYPRLTEVGSQRSGTCIGHEMNTSDSIPYGGYFTRAEAEELVRYAADRHITVIPEIDLPGHMLGALAAYPHLGCVGKDYEVWRRWGVADDILCAGRDSTYTFIADILNEIADIFPSEYIHIGGDEAPKVRWEECPRCQAKIEALGLASDSHSSKEQKLQTHVMQYASDVLKQRGRRIIGWEEMMEGGLPEGASVMSWLGVEGGHKAARMGHDAILSPMQYCYLDYYQSLDRANEPDAIGGFLPLERVYQLNPIPADFTPEEAAHIIGVQGNLWTEYIPSFSQVQYMLLPRLAAVSETQWAAQEKKDFKRFAERLPRLKRVYDAMGCTYAPHVYSKTYIDSVAPCLSSGCPVTLLTTPDSRYAPSAATLTDGYTGPMVFNTGAWFGFNGTPLEAVIDLRRPTEMQEVSVHTLYDTGNWIFPPTSLRVLYSSDGINFSEAAHEAYTMPDSYKAALQDVTLKFAPVTARYVKIELGCVTSMPEWHGGKGQPAYIFVDEISVL